jgi:hypothetical protein
MAKKKFRVIIAGSRSITNYQIVCRAIKESGWEEDITEVVSGKAKGVDKLGEDWAKAHNIPVKPFPAEWSKLDEPDAIIRENEYGKYDAKAGIRRNEKMAEYADALIAVIKDESSGTTHMIETMQKLDKKVSVWEI